MKKFIIPIEWSVCSEIEIEANSLKEAIEIAKDENDNIPLPTDNSYIYGTWRVNDDEHLINVLNYIKN
jgi:hypothetical protein